MVSKKSSAPKERKRTGKRSESSSNGKKAGGKEKVGRRRKRGREAEKREWLVERSEKGWITRKEVVSVVICGYCGEEGTSAETSYVRLDLIHDMWCKRYGPKKEWLDKEVTVGRKLKMKCTECGKKWVAARRETVEEGECGECREAKRRKEAVHPTKGNAQQKEEAKEERDVRRTIKMLKEVWMQGG